MQKLFQNKLEKCCDYFSYPGEWILDNFNLSVIFIYFSFLRHFASLFCSELMCNSASMVQQNHGASMLNNKGCFNLSQK